MQSAQPLQQLCFLFVLDRGKIWVREDAIEQPNQFPDHRRQSHVMVLSFRSEAFVERLEDRIKARRAHRWHIQGAADPASPPPEHIVAHVWNRCPDLWAPRRLMRRLDYLPLSRVRESQQAGSRPLQARRL